MKQKAKNKSPLSEETKVLRRNLLIVSGICLFIGVTGQLPEKFALLGVTFDASQKNIVGWFIVTVEAYLYLHFIASAMPEVAEWMEPLIESRIYRKKMESHPLHEDGYIPSQPASMQDYEAYSDEKAGEARYSSEYKLRFLFWFFYLKLAIEVVFPLIIGGCAIYKLYAIL